MKRPCVAAVCQLAKDTACEAKPCFNDKMHHVVWHQFIVARCWRHFDVRKRWAPYVDSVTSLSSALKLEKHDFIKPLMLGPQASSPADLHSITLVDVGRRGRLRSQQKSHSILADCLSLGF